jgi:hypothetical protein
MGRTTSVPCQDPFSVEELKDKAECPLRAVDGFEHGGVVLDLLLRA